MNSRVLCCFVFTLFYVTATAWDPYEVLGVSRRSSLQDIRKAYKKLAKEWHPDKNGSPEAEGKFVEVNKAYELLSDPERKKLYDQRGVFEDTPNFRKNNFHPDDNDPFSNFASFFGSGSGGFKFQFNMPEMGLYHKQNINLRLYEKSILPASYRLPHLIMVYSDWCLTCMHVLPLWQRLIEEMEPIGIALATVRYDREVELAEKLGAKRDQLPHIVLVTDSRPLHYREDQFSVIKIIEFIRSRIPSKLVSTITDDNVDTFLNGWKDNFVRVLLFGKLDVPRLRYLTLAFSFRSRAVFGYVQLNKDSSKELVSRFSVPTNLDSLLLFHEDSSKPVARLSMSDLPFSTMKDVIESNKYLALPRLSSQAMLDALCPAEASRTRRRLCVVLVTEDQVEDDDAREALRQFSRQFRVSKDRVIFTYVYRDKQQEFVNALASGEESPAEPQLHVAIVWRQEEKKVSYRWLAQPFIDRSDQWNSSKEMLQSTLLQLLGASQPLPYEAILKEMVDEHAQGLLARMVTRLAAATDILKEHITRQDLLAVGSVLGTILFIAAVGYVMAYLVRLEEESIRKAQNGKETKSMGRSATTELKLHEMRVETYNGMVRLLKPGCRTILLLVDSDSRTTLIPKFHRAVWPYRKNKSLTFGWMSVERGLNWYSQLLALSLKLIEDEEQTEEPALDVTRIKPRNCVGTVLALNGYRKYVCIYHARHPEGPSVKGGERMQRMARRLAVSQSQSLNGGEFMGFESSDDEDSSSDVDVEKGDPSLDEKPLITNGQSRNIPISVDSLLDGLPNWLDRLFEGTTHRYYINYWPEFGNY